MSKIVVIDPGHGGRDPGAVSKCGVREADLTFYMANKVKDFLEKKFGVDARVFQLDNVSAKEDINETVRYANSVKADYFFSIHVNAAGGTGYESFVHPHASDRSVQLNKIIHEEVSKFMASKSLRDRGMKTANFGVLRYTNMPASLHEILFIDNPNDLILLKDFNFLNDVSRALAEGIGKALVLPILTPKIVPATASGLAPAQDNPFSDIPKNHFAFDTWKWAHELGIVAGDLDSKMRPNDPATRSEVLTILRRYHTLISDQRGV